MLIFGGSGGIWEFWLLGVEVDEVGFELGWLGVEWFVVVGDEGARDRCDFDLHDER